MNQCENQPMSSRSSPGELALIHPADNTAVSRRDVDLTPLSVGSCETVDPVEPPVPDLPQPEQLGPPNFRWGNLDGNSFSRPIDKAYEETVHWKCNLFDVPRGNAGTLFVQEIARLLDAYSHATALEGIVLKAVMVLPALLLQKPHPKAKSKDLSVRLNDRFVRWQDGDIDSLLHEGRTIQSRLNTCQQRRHDGAKVARSFEKLVAAGNVKAALRLVTEQSNTGCLGLDSLQPDGRTVKDHLLDKHPPDNPAAPSTISGTPSVPEPHPIVFEQIDGSLIRSTIQRLSGSAGPSGMNAKGWKRMCSSFHRTSNELCEAIARLSRRICSTYVDPRGISSLVASRLIALDKSPGIRPIGVGEILRRLIGKVVLHIAQEDIQRTVGSLQLCAGQDAACEANSRNEKTTTLKQSY